MPNADALRMTLALVEDMARLNRWVQGEWALTEEHRIEFQSRGGKSLVSPDGTELHPGCGSAACFAGWTPYALGDESKVSRAIPSMINLTEDEAREFGEPGNAIHVSDYARVKLGLTEDQADWLFRGSNTLDDLREIVDELCGDENE